MKIGQSVDMAERPSGPKKFEDEWDTGAREGYEDPGVFRDARVPRREPGSSLLRGIGTFCILGGILWGVYLVFQGGDIVTTLQQNHGPVGIVALGVVVSLLGKYLRL
jgi:hypothetical protein